MRSAALIYSTGANSQMQLLVKRSGGKNPSTQCTLASERGHNRAHARVKVHLPGSGGGGGPACKIASAFTVEMTCWCAEEIIMKIKQRWQMNAARARGKGFERMCTLNAPWRRNH